MALKSILIVDDSPAIRKALCGLLKGIEAVRVCGEASDGLDGINKANALKPDIVILDLVMPRMDGLEAARAIRSSLPEDAVILLFTMYAERVAAIEAVAAGIDKVISKSNLPELLRCVELRGAGGAALPVWP